MQSLAAYIKANRWQAFQLGSHDCFTFTNGAWRVMHGRGYADCVIGKYAGLKPKEFAKLMRDNFGAVDIIDALDRGLSRVSGFPPKGALVIRRAERLLLTGYALGIAVGHNAVFVGENDLQFEPIGSISGAWL